MTHLGSLQQPRLQEGDWDYGCPRPSPSDTLSKTPGFKSILFKKKIYLFYLFIYLVARGLSCRRQAP